MDKILVPTIAKVSAAPKVQPTPSVGLGNRPMPKGPRFDNQRVVRSQRPNSGYRFGDFGRFGS